VAFESDDYDVIRELVASGAGIALLPDLAQRPTDGRVVLVSLGPGAPRRVIQAAARPEPIRTAAASAMLEILRAQPHPHPRVPAVAETADQAAAIASPPSR
jgi:DNA-binding transcriptional LysR family regulator